MSRSPQYHSSNPTRQTSSAPNPPSEVCYGLALFYLASQIQYPAQEKNLTAEILRIHPDEPEPELIARVVRALAAGQVAALPTDTFYGLAVDPINLRAVDRIYEVKTRARHKPLSLLISETAQAYGLAREIDTAFDRLAERFWPGPLTIVVKAGTRLPLRVTANTGNVALRVPEAAIARAVVASLGLPITATSANLRGMPECTAPPASPNSSATRSRSSSTAAPPSAPRPPPSSISPAEASPG